MTEIDWCYLMEPPPEAKWCEKHQEARRWNFMWTAPVLECKSCNKELEELQEALPS